MMQNLFMQGDPLFMGILTLIFLAVVVLGVYQWLALTKVETVDPVLWKNKIDLIKSVGLFGLILGIFAQLLGLYGGFAAIQQSGGIAAHVLTSGIQNSMITTLYGVFILIIAYVFWFWLQHTVRQKSQGAT